MGNFQWSLSLLFNKITKRQTQWKYKNRYFVFFSFQSQIHKLPLHEMTRERKKNNTFRNIRTMRSENGKNKRKNTRWDGTKIGLWYWTSIIAIYKLRTPHLRINITGCIISKFPHHLFCVQCTLANGYAQVLAAIRYDCDAVVRIQYTTSGFLRFSFLCLYSITSSLGAWSTVHNIKFSFSFVNLYLSHDMDIIRGIMYVLLVQKMFAVVNSLCKALKYPAFSFYYPSSRIYYSWSGSWYLRHESNRLTLGSLFLWKFIVYIIL